MRLPLTLRYNFSQGSYATVNVVERMHVPGIGVAISPNMTVLAELVLWHRAAPEGTTLIDRSVNMTLTGRF